MSDIHKLMPDAAALVRQAGQFILGELKGFDESSVETKSVNQLVSYVDKTAEEILVKGLGKLLPDAGFITEEDTIGRETKQYTWIIDPLDGTTNFIHKVPVFSVSVGLNNGDETVAGLVFDICNDELFHGSKGRGAFRNTEPITVSVVDSLDKSLLATGFPYYDFEQMQQYLDVLRKLLKQTHGLRRMGSAAIDLAYTACGRFDGFFEYSLNPWDVAAGAFLVKESGGCVADFKGGKDYLFGKTIIAANPTIMEEFSNVITQGFAGQAPNQ
ncbi:MAG: inositol monophosphatase [Flavobacteriaceae bacterium]|nr:inositol monophosphatase [Flavobacteriaceae bacterium]